MNPSKRLFRYLGRVAVGLLSVVWLLGHVLGHYRIDAIERLETRAYDLRLLATAKPEGETVVSIVDIDEPSLEAIGRWPWPRDQVAALVAELIERQGAAVVAFDVVFAEPDHSSGLPVLRRLAEGRLREAEGFQAALATLEGELDHDAMLARSLEGRSVILGYYFSSGESAAQKGALPEPAFSREDFPDRVFSGLVADGYGANLPVLMESALGAGHFNPLFDSDGVTRRVPLLIEFEGGFYEGLALATVRHALGGVPLGTVFGMAEGGYEALEFLRVGPLRIPLDQQLAALVPYRGPQGSFPYVSAAKVLQGRLPEKSLEGQIVLIGTSATGLMDLRSTPVGNAYPGVEIHANLIQGILEGALREHPSWVQGYDVLAVLLAGGLLALILPFLGPLASVVLACFMAVGVVGLAFFAWESAGLVLPMATPLLALIVVFLFHILYDLFFESRQRRQMAQLFGQYVPPRLVEQLADNPDVASMEGENREMTVLFSDVRNFTTISEGLPPHELARLMNAYLSQMTEAIQDSHGTIDKYIGDAVMAFWGAPLPSRHHALEAVKGALTMQATMHELRRIFAARQWPELHIGIGISTGVMTVGNMGSAFRRAYTVLGDAVNLGARLESLTKQYGAGILVAQRTVEATDQWIEYRELDRVQVKGKAQAVAIFEPLGRRDPLPAPSEGKPEPALREWATIPSATPRQRARAALSDRFLAHYYQQEWEPALTVVADMEKVGESPALVGLYRERVAHYQANPPPDDWDGAFRFTTK